MIQPKPAMTINNETYASGRSSFSARAEENMKPDPQLQMVFDALFNNQYDEKTNPNGVISLGVAENMLMSNEVTEFLNENFKLEPHNLTYGDGALGSRRLRRNLAEFFNDRFSPVKTVLPENVFVSAGLTSVVDELAWCFANPGDGMLIGMPMYGGFSHDLFGRARVNPVTVSLGQADPFSADAIQYFEAALQNYNAKGADKGNKIRGLILINPHNPLGKCYPVEVIKEYMRFCQRHQIQLISDEIYAMSIFENTDVPDAQEFHSILSIDHTGLIDEGLVQVLYGMSKDFGANGLRLGCVLTRNPKLGHAISSIATFGWAGQAGDLLWSTILEDKKFLEFYLKENQRRLGEHYQMLTKFLKKNEIRYVQGGTCGFFIWVDLRFALQKDPEEGGKENGEGEVEVKWDAEFELTKRMIEGGLYLATGHRFAAEEPGWFRITFSLEEKLLMLGLERLMKILKGEKTVNGNAIKNGTANGEEVTEPVEGMMAEVQIES